MGVWKVYEQLGWLRQQAMLEAAAMALKLVMNGQNSGPRNPGPPAHPAAAPAGLRGRATPARSPEADGRDQRGALQLARREKVSAAQIVAFLSIGGRSRTTYGQAQQLLIDVGVPAAMIPSFEEYLAATYA